jgi:hypothetical protein
MNRPNQIGLNAIDRAQTCDLTARRSTLARTAITAVSAAGRSCEVPAMPSSTSAMKPEASAVTFFRPGDCGQSLNRRRLIAQRHERARPCRRANVRALSRANVRVGSIAKLTVAANLLRDLVKG